MTGRYQPFYDLPAAQYEALKADIEAHGVLVPIVVDEDDVTIDGHQRRRACAELGIACPRDIRTGLTEEDKQNLAVALNAFRRHLSGTERANAVQQLRNIGWSTRRIGEQVGISHQAVQKHLKSGGNLVATSDEPPSSKDTVHRSLASPVSNETPPPNVDPALETVKGRDGKSYPASRPQPAPAKRKPSTTKAVAIALYKLADAAEAFEAIDRSRLGQYADEVPIWSENLAESLKAIQAFNEKLREISA